MISLLFFSFASTIAIKVIIVISTLSRPHHHHHHHPTAYCLKLWTQFNLHPTIYPLRVLIIFCLPYFSSNLFDCNIEFYTRGSRVGVGSWFCRKQLDSIAKKKESYKLNLWSCSSCCVLLCVLWSWHWIIIDCMVYKA